jgi:hypothetical protein
MFHKGSLVTFHETYIYKLIFPQNFKYGPLGYCADDTLKSQTLLYDCEDGISHSEPSGLWNVFRLSVANTKIKTQVSF